MTMPPDAHLTAADETLSPVDLPASAISGVRPVRWTSIVIATATLFLAVTNAAAIHGWALELEPSPVQARLVAFTEGWESTTDRIGIGAARAEMHALWKEAQAARFGGEAPAD